MPLQKLASSLPPVSCRWRFTLTIGRRQEYDAILRPDANLYAIAGLHLTGWLNDAQLHVVHGYNVFLRQPEERSRAYLSREDLSIRKRRCRGSCCGHRRRGLANGYALFSDAHEHA